jgi:hypothetical protein
MVKKEFSSGGGIQEYFKRANLLVRGLGKEDNLKRENEKFSSGGWETTRAP